MSLAIGAALALSLAPGTALAAVDSAALVEAEKASKTLALDPWDGAPLNPADRFTFYGDGCERISSR